MFRNLIIAVTVLVGVQSIRGQGIMVRVIGGDDNTVTIATPVIETKQVPEKITKIVNGKQVEETRMVAVQMTKMVEKKVPLKEIPVYNLEGERIAADKVADLFKKPIPVIVSPSGKIAPALKNVLKEGTLVVVLPSPASPRLPPPPAMPKPPPPPGK